MGPGQGLDDLSQNVSGHPDHGRLTCSWDLLQIACRADRNAIDDAVVEPRNEGSSPQKSEHRA